MLRGIFKGGGGGPGPQQWIGRTVRIGKYNVRVRELIAEGGFAYVFKVQDTATGEELAMKRLLAQDKEHFDSAQEEVALWEKIPPHKNVVALLGWTKCKVDGSSAIEFLLLTELCSGGNLVDIMNTRLHNRFSEQEVLRIFFDICVSVGHLHSQKPLVTHRDLKVENVLLASDGTWKLCDFGSATTKVWKPRASRHEMNDLELQVQKFTTMAYRAPEMVDLYLAPLVDHKTDIWALGCILFKLAYFKGPFDEAGNLQIMNCRYSFPSSPQYSPALKDFVKYMLNPDPALRPDIFDVLERACQLTQLPWALTKLQKPIKEVTVDLGDKSPPKTKSKSGGSAAAPASKPGGSGWSADPWEADFSSMMTTPQAQAQAQQQHAQRQPPPQHSSQSVLPHLDEPKPAKPASQSTSSIAAADKLASDFDVSFDDHFGAEAQQTPAAPPAVEKPKSKKKKPKPAAPPATDAHAADFFGGDVTWQQHAEVEKKPAKPAAQPQQQQQQPTPTEPVQQSGSRGSFWDSQYTSEPAEAPAPVERPPHRMVTPPPTLSASSVAAPAAVAPSSSAAALPSDPDGYYISEPDMGGRTEGDDVFVRGRTSSSAHQHEHHKKGFGFKKMFSQAQKYVKKAASEMTQVTEKVVGHVRGSMVKDDPAVLADIERWVLATTNAKSAPPKPKYLRSLVLSLSVDPFLHGNSRAAQTLLEGRFATFLTTIRQRPLFDSQVVCLKTLVVFLKVLEEAVSPDFFPMFQQFESGKLVEVLGDIQRRWSLERNPNGPGTSVDLLCEVAEYCQRRVEFHITYPEFDAKSFSLHRFHADRAHNPHAHNRPHTESCIRTLLAILQILRRIRGLAFQESSHSFVVSCVLPTLTHECELVIATAYCLSHLAETFQHANVQRLTEQFYEHYRDLHRDGSRIVTKQWSLPPDWYPLLTVWPAMPPSMPFHHGDTRHFPVAEPPQPLNCRRSVHRASLRHTVNALTDDAKKKRLLKVARIECLSDTNDDDEPVERAAAPDTAPSASSSSAILPPPHHTDALPNPAAHHHPAPPQPLLDVHGNNHNHHHHSTASTSSLPPPAATAATSRPRTNSEMMNDIFGTAGSSSSSQIDLMDSMLSQSTEKRSGTPPPPGGSSNAESSSPNRPLSLSLSASTNPFADYVDPNALSRSSLDIPTDSRAMIISDDDFAAEMQAAMSESHQTSAITANVANAKANSAAGGVESGNAKMSGDATVSDAVENGSGVGVSGHASGAAQTGGPGTQTSGPSALSAGMGSQNSGVEVAMAIGDEFSGAEMRVTVPAVRSGVSGVDLNVTPSTPVQQQQTVFQPFTPHTPSMLASSSGRWEPESLSLSGDPPVAGRTGTSSSSLATVIVHDDAIVIGSDEHSESPSASFGTDLAWEMEETPAIPVEKTPPLALPGVQRDASASLLTSALRSSMSPGTVERGESHVHFEEEAEDSPKHGLAARLNAQLRRAKASSFDHSAIQSHLRSSLSPETEEDPYTQTSADVDGDDEEEGLFEKTPTRSTGKRLGLRRAFSANKAKLAGSGSSLSTPPSPPSHRTSTASIHFSANAAATTLFAPANSTTMNTSTTNTTNTTTNAMTNAANSSTNYCSKEPEESSNYSITGTKAGNGAINSSRSGKSGDYSNCGSKGREREREREREKGKSLFGRLRFSRHTRTKSAPLPDMNEWEEEREEEREGERENDGERSGGSTSDFENLDHSRGLLK